MKGRVLVLLAIVVGPAWAGNPHASNSGSHQVVFSPIPEEWPMQRPFEVHLSIHGPAIEEVVVHARMPQHLHGLVRQPLVHPGNQANEFRIEGLDLHMPGVWEIYFDLRTGALTERVQIDRTLP